MKIQSKKSTILTLLGLSLIFSFISIYWLIFGSFEQFPTEEQEGKVEIVAGIAAAIFLLSDILLCFLLQKVKN